MIAPPGSWIRTCAVVAPFFTSMIFPLRTFRALSFIDHRAVGFNNRLSIASDMMRR